MIRRLAVPGLLLLAAYYAIFGGGYSVFDLNRIHDRIDRAVLEREALREESRLLEERVSALEEDPHTVERLARERFGMIRDGEVLYRFAEPLDEDSAEVDTEGLRR